MSSAKAEAIISYLNEVASASPKRLEQIQGMFVAHMIANKDFIVAALRSAERMSIISLTLNEDMAEEIAEALKNYKPNLEDMKVSVISSNEQYDNVVEDLENERGTRLTFEVALSRIYKETRERLGIVAMYNMADGLRTIQRICKEYLDPIVIKDLDEQESDDE